MKVPKRIAESARARIAAATNEINKSSDKIQGGKPLLAEPQRDRAIARVATVAHVDSDTAARIVDYDDPAALGLTGASLRKAEALQGKTVDYLGVAWLEAGRLASHAVARICNREGSPLGTGFLVSDRLLMTNNHVIGDSTQASELIAEFGYEVSLSGGRTKPVRFLFDPATFFETDSEDDLDFTLIALGRSLDPAGAAKTFGRCPLSASAVKHSVGEPVNIIQHPNGDYKQIVVRENRILHRGDNVLHYVADTEPGASGSPVFNDEWHVVALHHWGEPYRQMIGSDGRVLNRDVNEGIRISAIVAELKKRQPSLSANQRRLLDDALTAPPPSDFGTRELAGTFLPGPQSITDGLASFSYAPSRLPEDTESPPSDSIAPVLLAGAETVAFDRNYANRKGYNPDFLPGLHIPLPQLNAGQLKIAPRVRGIGSDGNPHELKYQHFSVVVNAARRMAFYSICNIDGAKHISVDRSTGEPKSGPEAGERWTTDERIPLEAQLSDSFYARLRRDVNLPGSRPGQYKEFFARGHLTRREDPNWGDAERARRANADTFHHTNACPQVQNNFNGSKSAWLGLEDYVLGSADDSNLRVTVITGPVFDERDPVYQDPEFGQVALPQRFWKIVVRIEEDQPKVFALLADQSATMDLLFRLQREALWDWPERLSTEYKSSVTKIAELTGLDFGELAKYDVFAGTEEEGMEVRSPHDLFPALRRPGQGFGRFASIGDFLDEWEARLREVPEGKREAPEAVKRRKKKRLVVEISASVAKVFADDLSGAKHQQFTVIPQLWRDGDGKTQELIEAAIKLRSQARVAVRFGDSRGLPDRISGIMSGKDLHIKGEWIPAELAYAMGGERLAVLHFTHEPLGFICMDNYCYD